MVGILSSVPLVNVSVETVSVAALILPAVIVALAIMAFSTAPSAIVVVILVVPVPVTSPVNVILDIPTFWKLKSDVPLPVCVHIFNPPPIAVLK